MAANAWQAPPANASALWSTAIRRAPYVLDVAEDSQTIDLQTSLVVYRDGSFFGYDPTDTTTVHDGVAVLVDQNGRRYKLTDDLKIPVSVLDRTGTPPTSTGDGDAYLVTAGATGAWAGQDDDVAVDTAQGWRFIAPRPGRILYVEDETAYYHHSAAGAWVAGLGSLSLSAGSVTPVEQQFWGGLAIESGHSDPPASPSNGQAYLIGSSPTGEWIGHNGEIAYRRGGAWVYLQPYDGARAFNKFPDVLITYNNGSWSSPVEIQPTETEIIDLGGLSGYDALDLGDFVKVEAYLYNAATTAFVRTSADNGGSFAAAAAAYWNFNTGANATSVTLFTTTSGGHSFGWVSISGFNKAVKTSFRSESGTANFHYFRQTAEVNNALRFLHPTGATYPAGTSLLLLKYRG